MPILVLNAGSSSLKYCLNSDDGTERILEGKLERLGDDFDAAIAKVFDAVADHTVVAVGHRVVHGGRDFADAVVIDDDALAAIERNVDLAPLHNPRNLACIRAAQSAMPDVPHVAVFDTAFHRSLPRRARLYGIDPVFADEHGIERYGFHGSSHAFVAREAARALGRPLQQLRVITCHLGNGSSVCAVECGKSVETSMGMTPLEGLIMGTRSGDIDPGALLMLLEKGALTVDELSEQLQKKSGLLGLSGISNDLRDIEAAAADGDDRARLALTLFAHRVRKTIGAYAATMGGVDVVVMTGGIGENSATMRRRILQRFEFLGLSVCEDRNYDANSRTMKKGDVADISRTLSNVRALVVKTDEERMIAEQAARFVQKPETPRKLPPIPIAVSARHVHLDEPTFKTLFGDDAELHPYKPLSQPGQYAAEERVNLVGPRSRIDGVRILGPLRPACQVEISRTDEFALGVDAPVRHSGDVKGTAPITLEGPKGTVHLKEGLICAWRHIHMTPEDAAAYGVEDRDEVQVAVHGGDRDLIFGDVVVRVSSKYKTEMHIDTDEANAAELPSRSAGELVEVKGATVELTTTRPSLG